MDREERGAAIDEETQIISIAPKDFSFDASEAIVMDNTDNENGMQSSQDVEALLALALSLDKSGNYAEMLEVAQQVIDREPGSALALACKARALQKLERLSEATIANDQALLLDTNLPLAWLNRSGLQILQERYPEGLRSAQRSIELAPQDARAWANKGMALLNLNNKFGALEAMNQSLACDPDYLFALQIKGEILRHYGRMHELAQIMRHALELAPGDVNALSLMIVASRALEEYEELPLITSQLTQLTPESPFAWDSHMRTLRALGRFEEANEAIDRLLELVPQDVRIWAIKADNLYRQERYREAVQVATQALHLEPQYPPAQRIHEKSLRQLYQNKTSRRKK